MKITLSTDGNLNNYVAKNENGNSLYMASDESAFRPMQTLLAAAAGCSTIDMVTFLEKMRQKVEDIHVEIEGTRRDEVPRIFTKVHLHYIVIGEVKEEKAKKAMDLSIEKYCSVLLSLDKDIEITSSYEVKTEA